MKENFSEQALQDIAKAYRELEARNVNDKTSERKDEQNSAREPLVEQRHVDVRAAAAAGLNQLHIANSDHGQVRNEDILNEGIKALSDMPEADLQVLLDELRK